MATAKNLTPTCKWVKYCGVPNHQHQQWCHKSSSHAALEAKETRWASANLDKTKVLVWRRLKTYRAVTCNWVKYCGAPNHQHQHHNGVTKVQVMLPSAKETRWASANPGKNKGISVASAKNLTATCNWVKYCGVPNHHQPIRY